MLNLPSWKHWAQRETVLRSTVSTPHTSISELWISVGVFLCNVSILMYTRWSSLVTVPWDTNSRHFNALSFPRAHTSGDIIHCTTFQKVSSATAEMAGQMASLFTQCYQRVHFFWDHPRTLHAKSWNVEVHHWYKGMNHFEFTELNTASSYRAFSLLSQESSQSLITKIL